MIRDSQTQDASGFTFSGISAALFIIDDLPNSSPLCPSCPSVRPTTFLFSHFPLHTRGDTRANRSPSLLRMGEVRRAKGRDRSNITLVQMGVKLGRFHGKREEQRVENGSTKCVSRIPHSVSFFCTGKCDLQIRASGG